MGHFAFVDDGDGLEPAVRVLADAARTFGRLERVRAGVVEQRKRIQIRAVRVVRKD